MAGEEIGGVDSRSLAQETVAAALAQEGQIAEETPPELSEDLSRQLEEQPGLETPGQEEVTPVQPTPTPQEEVPDDQEEFAYDEVVLELARHGIDLGVSRAEVPPEMQPVYDRLVDIAISQAQDWANQNEQLASAQAEIQQFAQKLQDDPEKVLLTMAVTNPEAFRHAVESYERMGQDEFYRDTVIKDLRAEAKAAAAERQEQLFMQRMRNQRIAQVTRATHVAADRYGVAHELAEEFVAGAITRNGGDIELSAIPQLISRLAPTRKAPLPAQEKVRRTATAPTPNMAGKGSQPQTSSGSPAETSPGLKQASRNPWMNLVKDAAAKLRTGNE